jgi:hypothetical protein
MWFGDAQFLHALPVSISDLGYWDIGIASHHGVRKRENDCSAFVSFVKSQYVSDPD